jgi:hypothetical protein
MVLAFLRIKFIGPEKSLRVAGSKRIPYVVEGAFRVETVGLPPQLHGGMGIGVGYQCESVKEGNPPVHLRIGTQTGLDGENMRCQIIETGSERVEAGLGSQYGKPGGPDMGRDQEGAVRNF